MSNPHDRRPSEPGPGGRPDASHQAETIAFDGDTGKSAKGSTAIDQPLRVYKVPESFGRYRIKRQLGKGGMASVYLAQDSQLDREVALKIPHLADEDAANYTARLLREARSAAALRHPNICPVYDVGEVNGVPYLAMAYIQGRTLAEYVRSPKPQSERSIAIIVYKVAQALAEAHSHKVLHRDLKPANIMLDRKGEPIVMDFGLAQQYSGKQSRLTQEGMIVGTPEYMAPEQIDNRAPVGPATDVYSLGVVLYELLTQRSPFQGTAISIIGQVLNTQPTPINKIRPEASPILANICQKAMAKEPAQRYGSMSEFAAALMNFVKTSSIASALTVNADKPVAPLAELLGPAPALEQPGTSLLPAYKPPPRPIPPLMLWGGIGVVGILVLLIIAINSGGGSAGSASKEPVTASVPNTPAVSPAKTNSPSASPTKSQPTTTEGPLPPKVESPPAKEKEAMENANRTSATESPNDPPASANRPPRDPLWDHEAENQKLSVEERFRRADRNGDGKLTRGEIPFHLSRRADANGDGEVTLEELRAAVDRLKHRFFEPPGEGDGPPRPPPPSGKGDRPPPPPPRKGDNPK